MQHLMILTLRPLLYAAAAAVTAAGVYYYIKMLDDGEKTAAHAHTHTHTSHSQEAVQGLCAGSDLLHDEDGGSVSQTASGVTAEVSLAEAEKRCESCALLQNETSRLLSDVAVLQESVKEKEQELCEMNRKLDAMTLESQATLDEFEQEYEKVMKTEAKLKQKNANLTLDLDLLKNYVRQMEIKLSQDLCRNRRLRSEHKHDLEAYSALKLQYEQMVETFTHNEELLKASLANSEEKYELQIASFAQLQSDLMAQVNTLQASVQQLEEELRESRRKCDEMTRNGRI